MPSFVNTMTSAEWKSMREKAGIEKTKWWKGAGPSVGSKLEAWQKARREVKAVLNEMKIPTYIYKRGDMTKMSKAFDTLNALEAAIKAMLKIADKKEIPVEKAKDFDAMKNHLNLLLVEIEGKKPKYSKALLALKPLKDGDKQSAVKGAISDNFAWFDPK